MILTILFWWLFLETGAKCFLTWRRGGALFSSSNSSSQSSSSSSKEDSQFTTSTAGNNSPAASANHGDALSSLTGNVTKNGWNSQAITLNGSGTAIKGDNNTVTFTDNGSVAAALDLAKTALIDASNNNSSNGSVDAITTALKGQTDLLNSTIQRIGSNNTTTTGLNIPPIFWAALAAVAGLIGWLMLKKKTA